MSLHVETQGSGAPLLLIHGWGMHGGVWSEVAQKLAADFQVHSVDLPGYGLSGKGEVGRTEAREGGRGKGDTHPAPVARPSLSGGLPFPLPPFPLSLDSIVDELSACFTEPLNVCGWSLGGQIAQRWAVMEPAKVRRLILVTSTPCFSERDDWLFGMAKEVLEKFAAELEQNHAATLRRFISLQLRGSENERELLTVLREKLFSRGEPDITALRAGLDVLRDADQRSELSDIKQPTLVIAGERDKLTPPEASYHMARVIPNARLVEVKGAAHAPFLSHPEFFVEQVKRFLHE
jgi:pimeloyl-[acyl-carrier protein] methyl ester esterase